MVMYKMYTVYLVELKMRSFTNENEVQAVEVVFAYAASAKAALLLITASCVGDPSSNMHESITQPPKVDISHQRDNSHWMHSRGGKKTLGPLYQVTKRFR
jgi:hypothetical protein